MSTHYFVANATSGPQFEVEQGPKVDRPGGDVVGVVFYWRELPDGCWDTNGSATRGGAVRAARRSFAEQVKLSHEMVSELIRDELRAQERAERSHIDTVRLRSTLLAGNWDCDPDNYLACLDEIDRLRKELKSAKHAADTSGTNAGESR